MDDIPEATFYEYAENNYGNNYGSHRRYAG
jgi:hypothetical protein